MGTSSTDTYINLSKQYDLDRTEHYKIDKQTIVDIREITIEHINNILNRCKTCKHRYVERYYCSTDKGEQILDTDYCRIYNLELLNINSCKYKNYKED